MKKTFTLKPLLLLFILGMMNINSYSQTLIEDFNYPANTLLTAAGYTAISAPGINPITVSAPGLTYNGSPSSNVGNAVRLTTSGEDDTKSISTPISSGSAYASLLVNVTSTQSGGDYFFALYDAGGYKGRLWIKTAGAGFYFGISKNSTTSVFYESNQRFAGITYLLVLKYTFNSGSSTDDEVSLFVNPTLGSSEPVSPTIAATTSAGADDATSIDRIALRQGTATIASAQTVDGIRVGTTWASVTAVAVQVATSTSLTSSLNPSTYGQNVTFTATVTSTATPTGTVTFFDGANVLGTGTLTGTTATFSTSALAGGSHNITATYNSDANNAASTSAALNQGVNTLPTSTSVTSSLNPSSAGQSITFTARITSSGSVTGSVTFFDGATAIGAGTLSGSVASFTTTALSIGSHNITASYDGDANNDVSTSAILTQVVVKATTTSLASSLNPSTVGQNVTFTATIAVASGSVTGTVTFFDGSTTIGTGNVSGNVATFSTSALAAASHSITARYNGDADYGTSTSSALIQVVNKATTATSVISSLNPSIVGQSVTFTATISGAFGTPTGTVTFLDGTTTLGSGNVSGTTATFSASALTVGSHNITARYNGDASNLTSTSSVLTQVVNKSTTTISVSSSLNPSIAGQSVTFTATISGASLTPTGTVAFFDGTTTLGYGNVYGTTATFSTSTLSVGSHNITATYNGDANNITSTSSILIQVVNKATTATSVSSYLNPSTLNQSVTFSATISGTFTSPTGTVTFFDGITTLGSGNVYGTTATFSTSTLSVGSHNITATYNGDANSTVSTSSALTQIVNKATSTTSISSSLNPSTTGRNVTFTATISGVFGTPTGTVNFFDGIITLGAGTISGTTATFSTSTLSAGSHSIIAMYSGDANYATSSSSVLTQVVNQATSISNDYFRSRQSGNWNDVNTWESSFVADFSAGLVSPATLTPDAGSRGTTILSGHTVTVTANVTTATDHTFVNPGGTLIVTGSTLTAYGLTFKSDALGTGRLGPSSGSITGAGYVQRFIPANTSRAWRLLSVPNTEPNSINYSWQNGQAAGVTGPPGLGTIITGTNGNSGFDYQTPSSMLTYNASTNNWTGITSTGFIIATSSGYMLFVRGDRTATPYNTIKTATTLTTRGYLAIGNTTPLSVNANQYGLIGNPYVSQIDFRNVTKSSGIDNIFYVWDPKLSGESGVGGYQTLTFNGTNYIITPGGGSYGASGSVMNTIESGMAFFVHATSSGTISFTENAKSSGSTSSVFRTIEAPVKSLITNLYSVETTGNNLIDGTMNMFDNNYSNEVDAMDAQKLTNFGVNFGIIKNNKILTVEKRNILNESDAINFSLSNAKQQQYRLEFITSGLNQQGLNAFLEDKYLKTRTSVNLNGTTTITFIVNSDSSSSAANRFSIVFAKPASIVNAIPSIAVYPNPVLNGNIQLQFTNMPQGKYSVRLLNNLGQLITTKQINHTAGSSTENLNVNSIIKGIYHIDITTPDNYRISKKVIAD